MTIPIAGAAPPSRAQLTVSGYESFPAKVRWVHMKELPGAHAVRPCGVGRDWGVGAGGASPSGADRADVRCPAGLPNRGRISCLCGEYDGGPRGCRSRSGAREPVQRPPRDRDAFDELGTPDEIPRVPPATCCGCRPWAVPPTSSRVRRWADGCPSRPTELPSESDELGRSGGT
jgi:hypothetical protein